MSEKRREEKITWFKLDDSLPDTLHNTSTLVAQHYREDSLRVGPTQCVGVSVTDPCGHNLKDKTAI